MPTPKLSKEMLKYVSDKQTYSVIVVLQHPRDPGLHFCRSGSCCFEIESLYDTSMALVTFSFGSVFGMVIVRMPSSTLAEILSFTTSSGNT